ncbi:MAG TPA: ParA family protein [Anaeromyxobacteraceae bacterium]|nr:ParA family protein [Anaeromyxobacteraceae bacterium]
MRTIAVAGGKGGSGKTSVAVHLAVGLARRRKRVLLVDLDPTRHASTWLLGPLSEAKGIADVLLEERVRPEHRHHVEDGLEVLPATRALQSLDLKLANEPGGQFILRRALEDLENIDFTLLDCPPALGYFTTAAVFAADAILAPLACSPLCLAGLELLEEHVSLMSRRAKSAPLRVDLVLFAADSREALTAETRALLESKAGKRLMRSEIRVSTAGKMLPTRRKTAWDGGDPRGAEDYAALLAEVLGRWNASK